MILKNLSWKKSKYTSKDPLYAEDVTKIIEILNNIIKLDSNNNIVINVSDNIILNLGASQYKLSVEENGALSTELISN